MKYITGAIIAIILLTGTFFAGFYVSQTYFPKETEAEKINISDTTWKDKYDQLQKKLASMPKIEPEKITPEDLTNLVFCYNHGLDAESYVEDNILFVTMSDSCKKATIKYKISAKDYKHFIQAAMIYQYQLGYSIELSYIYNFKFVGIGAGLIINKDNPGIKAILQKGFY